MRDLIVAAQLGEPSRSPEGANVFEFNFPLENPVFAGHFPGRPILPGVVQLEMVRVASESVLNGPLEIREIRKAKFQRAIAPGETMRMELKLSNDEGMVRARATFSVDGQAAGETVLFLATNPQNSR
jgi:3-hydroxyacyl-[acyl-carrier-protein] dehydratase